MKQLSGIVAPVTAHPTPPDARTAEHQAAIVQAAMDYVTALHAWETRPKFSEELRRELHRTQRRLVEAVKGT